MPARDCEMAVETAAFGSLEAGVLVSAFWALVFGPRPNKSPWRLAPLKMTRAAWPRLKVWLCPSRWAHAAFQPLPMLFCQI